MRDAYSHGRRLDSGRRVPASLFTVFHSVYFSFLSTLTFVKCDNIGELGPNKVSSIDSTLWTFPTQFVESCTSVHPRLDRRDRRCRYLRPQVHNQSNCPSVLRLCYECCPILRLGERSMNKMRKTIDSFQRRKMKSEQFEAKLGRRKIGAEISSMRR